MNHVLMIAYHYPPYSGSSGVQRTLRFSQDLTAYDWQPSVLSAHPRAYEKSSSDLLKDVPANVDVRRAFALDASRHLSLFKRYPGWIARPDRWISWLVGALATGCGMIGRHRPDVIWSTYPIATAHLIGYWLHRLTGIPWVADFRDPMAHAGYPPDKATWDSYLGVERKVFERACRMVFTTPGAAKLYALRYPAAAGRIEVIENGYNEASFESLASGDEAAQVPLNPGKFTLLHSGIVYPEWRNPKELFAALRTLFDAGIVDRQSFQLRFRAAEHVKFLERLVVADGLADVVQILPPIGYRSALAEMCAADGLLVLQSFDCCDQIPAKVYEYVRANKPILGLCGTSGDTAEVLRRAGSKHLSPLEKQESIGAALIDFMSDIRSGKAPAGSRKFVESASRRSKAKDLAQLFNAVLAERSSRIQPVP
jgi:glycosyltransferase involved in cell wall biosynthesis